MSVDLLPYYALLIYLLFGIRIVEPHEWLVVSRFGKYCGFRREGMRWVIPFVEKTDRVDLNQVSETWKDTPEEILETEVKRWLELQSSI